MRRMLSYLSITKCVCDVEAISARPNCIFRHPNNLTGLDETGDGYYKNLSPYFSAIIRTEDESIILLFQMFNKKQSS
jgi:hypothetical protein